MPAMGFASMEKWTQTLIALLTFPKSNDEFNKMMSVLLNLFGPVSGTMTMKEKEEKKRSLLSPLSG